MGWEVQKSVIKKIHVTRKVLLQPTFTSYQHITLRASVFGGFLQYNDVTSDLNSDQVVCETLDVFIFYQHNSDNTDNNILHFFFVN